MEAGYETIWFMGIVGAGCYRFAGAGEPRARAAQLRAQRKALVGCQYQYAVQLLGAMLVGIVQVLFDVDVHHQRLAAACGAPKSQIAQVVLGEVAHPVPALGSQVEVVMKKRR